MWWKRVAARLRRVNTSTTRATDGSVQIHETRRFKGLPMSVQKEVNDIIENECREQFIRCHDATQRPYETLNQMQERSGKIVPAILNNVNGPASLVERVSDAIGFRDFGGSGQGRMGGMSNMSWMTGVNGQDPSMNNMASPNLYLTPGEATSIYSNKGLPEIIIDKKSRSMILNGVKIKNKKLSPEQLEKINDAMVKTGLHIAMADALADALVYSGSILFPMFRGDNPITMTLDVPTLARAGVVKKNCIERWVKLDRWNTVHFPNWNPTSEDFLKPKYFYIPFMGTDVNSSRIARIVPSPQRGYWGVMMTMGWGVSDIVGWIEAVFNYMNTMRAIPTMIQQMSLLARTFNVDGPLAMEGSMLLDQMADEDTIRVRNASVLNPINLDVVGELKAIERNFSEVPELLTFIRQDLAAKAGFLEEGLFTIKKSGMGGGNDKKQPWTRQEETNRIMYSKIQQQLKPVAMLHIINTLGLDRDVMQALEYTEICFDEQKITDVEDKVKVTEATTKGFFDAVAGGMPLQDAADMVSQLSGGLFNIDADLRRRLEERQEIIDQRETEEHEANIASINATTQAALIADDGTETSESTSTGADGKKTVTKKTNQRKHKVLSSASGENQGNSYADPMEQRKHEKVGGAGTKKQGIKKARNKIVG